MSSHDVIELSFRSVLRTNLGPGRYGEAVPFLIGLRLADWTSTQRRYLRNIQMTRTTAAATDRLRDFTADRRVLILAALAIVAGGGGTFAAVILLRLIALF